MHRQSVKSKMAQAQVHQKTPEWTEDLLQQTQEGARLSECSTSAVPSFGSLVMKKHGKEGLQVSICTNQLAEDYSCEFRSYFDFLKTLQHSLFLRRHKAKLRKLPAQFCLNVLSGATAPF